jgi:hypothetical protein
MYNVTQELPSEQKTGFIDAGIHENLVITNVRYEKKDTGTEFIAFDFLNPETGEIGSHTEYKAKANNPEDLVKKEMNQMSRLKQIALCFINKEQFVFSAISFEDFANKVISSLGDNYKGVKIRAKFVYSGNSNYTSLPNMWQARFIERMDNNGNYGESLQKTKIKILSKDVITKTPDPVPQTQNPFLANTENPFIS